MVSQEQNLKKSLKNQARETFILNWKPDFFKVEGTVHKSECNTVSYDRKEQTEPEIRKGKLGNWRNFETFWHWKNTQCISGVSKLMNKQQHVTISIVTACDTAGLWINLNHFKQF